MVVHEHSNRMKEIRRGKEVPQKPVLPRDSPCGTQSKTANGMEEVRQKNCFVPPQDVMDINYYCPVLRELSFKHAE